MLRRSQTVASQADDEAPEPGPARYDVDWGTTSTLDRRLPTDRRQSDRRGMDRLRAEALQAVISRVEDRNFGGIKDRLKWPRSLPLSRLLLIVVAVGAAGTAAWLATNFQQPAPPEAAPVATMPIETAPAQVSRILVAAQQIPLGQRLTEQSLQWQDWPDSAMRPEFITASAEPDALTKMQGSVARVDFVAGDPIVQQKLAPAGGGFLSSILDKGKRAVSVTIAAESASGGFVVPNDRVDVVLTRSSDETKSQESHTILRDVRVLAINTRLGSGPAAEATEGQDPSTQAFADKAIATLELDPTQSEVIINATSLGRLSLVLRPAVETPSAATGDTPSDSERATNAAIRLSSPFWTK